MRVEALRSPVVPPVHSFLTRCRRTLVGLAGLCLMMTASVSGWAQTNGYHDVADCSMIAGWAWDASQPTTPLSVDIYSDNTLIGSVGAGTFRQDLLNAGIGDGNHGFQIATPAAMIDGQPHTLAVKYGGTQTNLNNTPKTVSCIAPGQPTPSYEGYLEAADCTHIALWAWDRTQPNTPITVDLYDGATLIATVSANAFRQDLLNAGKGNGIHSADIPLPAGLINGQGHTLTAKYGGTQTSLNASPKTLSCIAPGQPTPSYEGYLDVADCTHIAGWGWDQNQAGTPIGIDLYDGTTLIATVSAGAFRQDLLNAGKGNGAHGFDISLPAGLINGQGHTITAMFSGTQTSLNTSPKTLSCVAPGQPTPAYNGYHDGADCTGITGWAWDANQPAGMVSVDVYDGATKIATVAANQFRQDLVNAGIGDGLHGFQFATPNSVKDGTSHVITLRYAGTQQNLNTTPKSLTCAAVGARLYYLFPDHLGTPRLAIDEANNIVWRNLPTTEPFGNSPVEEDPGNTGTPFKFNLRFPGQYADRETSLNYNFFRDYDPGTGRYPQSDPIGLVGGTNTYSYVNGNPVSRVDPLGLSDVLIRISRTQTTSRSTMGDLTVSVDGRPEFNGYSLEPSGTNGARRLNEGTYGASVYSSPRLNGRDVLLLDGTDPMTFVEIHPGNRPDDTRGCVLPGTTQRNDFVGGSRPAFERIMDVVRTTQRSDASRGERTTIRVQVE